MAGVTHENPEPRAAAVVVVPGRNAVLPDHWLARWGREHPEFRWARHSNTDDFDLDDRVAALRSAIDATSGPVVLVAHSAGCVTVAHWAARHSAPVHGALLATPPDLDQMAAAGQPAAADPGPRLDLPRARLPFPAVLVASRNDEAMTFDRAAELARDWGATLVDAGPVGHLNTAAGFGPWPLGEKLLAELRSPDRYSRSGA